MKTVTVLSVGIGGYGGVLLADMLEHENAWGIKIVGAVEPYPESAPLAAKLAQRGTPVYPDIGAFYAENKVDLAVIATPIRYHKAGILACLQNGSNVLCEKPLCADENDISDIIKARDEAGLFVYIGYQWSHAEAIGALKADILNGDFGKPLDLRTLVLWPRDEAYFKRGTGWAGKITDGGVPVYDSIANNAAAHYLHNIFYLLGEKPLAAKAPVSFTADLTRANPIENFDTAVIRMTFEGGAKALFAASHAVEKNLDPLFRYEFERGTVYFSQGNVPDAIADAGKYEPGCIVSYMADGTIRTYGNPFENAARKVFLAAKAVRGEPDGYERCGVETAAVHTRFINALQRTAVIRDEPEERLARRDKLTYVKGLYDELIGVYAAG